MQQPIQFLRHAQSRAIKEVVKKVLSLADIKIDGTRQWDIKVKNPNIYNRIRENGMLGAGEGYMHGEWECDDIVELAHRISLANIDKLLERIVEKHNFFLSRDINPFEIAEKHYNLPQELFISMLDKQMVYSCAYWNNAKTLEEAQRNKLDLVCKKINLKKGMRVLDIGGGWGSFAKFASKNYGVSVVNITVSKQQLALANKLCAGLPVENRLQDYKDLNDKPYDRIVSIGMFEHVRAENYRMFMEIVNQHLAPNGIFLLHSIGDDDNTDMSINSWITTYIFPNSEIPNSSSLTQSFEDLFVMEDWHNLSTNYEKTLLEWFKRFNKNWPKLRPLFTNGKDPEEFYRMWKLYLLGSAGGFRSRKLQIWQIVLSKEGIPGGYQSIR